MGNIVPTLRRIPMSLLTFLILSLLFPTQGSKATRRTAVQAQAAGQAPVTRLIVTVRDEGVANLICLESVTLKHLDIPVFTTGTTMCGQTVFGGLGPGEYTIVVSAPGYLTATERVNLTHGSESEQAYIALKRDSSSSTVVAPQGPPALSPKLQKELGKAVGALQANRLEEAQKHADEAYRLAPGNPEVNYIRGLLADRRGKLAVAQASWEKTLSLDPSHGLTLQALATMMARKGDYPAAKGYLERALQVDANSWRAHELLAVVCFRQSDFAEAVSHAERSLELGKNLANGARLPLAESLIQQNQIAPAMEVLRAFLDGRPAKEQAAIANNLMQKLSVPAPPSPAASESNSTTMTETAELPELPLLKPELPKWIPPNVDEFLPGVEPGIACPLREILDGAADHVREFMKSGARITATEHLNYLVVKEGALETREERRA